VIRQVIKVQNMALLCTRLRINRSGRAGPMHFVRPGQRPADLSVVLPTADAIAVFRALSGEDKLCGFKAFRYGAGSWDK